MSDLCFHCRVAKGFKRRDKGAHTGVIKKCDGCEKKEIILPSRHWVLPGITKQQEIDQLKAQVEHLLKDLSLAMDCWHDGDPYHLAAHITSLQQPVTQSLAEHDAALLEKLWERYVTGSGWGDSGFSIMEDLRREADSIRQQNSNNGDTCTGDGGKCGLGGFCDNCHNLPHSNKGEG